MHDPAINRRAIFGCPSGTSDNRAGDVAHQIPYPMAGVEEGLAKEEHAEKDGGDDEGKEGPCPDVEVVVGRRLGAHGER